MQSQHKLLPANITSENDCGHWALFSLCPSHLAAYDLAWRPFFPHQENILFIYCRDSQINSIVIQLSQCQKRVR